MSRKLILVIVAIAFIFGTIGSIVFNRFVFPYLSTVPGFAWVGRLQSNAPIVISRREEVRLNEGVNLIELTKQAQTVVVSIYSPGANARLLGNGLIITSDGTIFTTKEVVGTNTNLTVITDSGAVLPAQVRAMDPKSPIAVISVTGKDMPVAQFSDAGNMQTAQRIFALGQTNKEFTREFVSGLVSKTLSNNLEPERVLNTEVFENTLTTDADMNNRYVGGPVVNLQGLIVGMIVGVNGQVLPAEYMEGAIRTYLESGKISRPYIGMRYVSINGNSAKAKGLSVAGAQVTGIEPNSPAGTANLAVNDIIVEVNGQKVVDSSLEQLLVAQNSNEMRLLVRRGNENRELTLKPELR
ncbi:MAG TPA: S1C family serine protease [Candidatus Binatia bacterium]|nr:S1C family serine protease [Candidatus Binatia bacterium]